MELDTWSVYASDEECDQYEIRRTYINSEGQYVQVTFPNTNITTKDGCENLAKSLNNLFNWGEI